MKVEGDVVVYTSMTGIAILNLSPVHLVNYSHVCPADLSSTVMQIAF